MLTPPGIGLAQSLAIDKEAKFPESGLLDTLRFSTFTSRIRPRYLSLVLVSFFSFIQSAETYSQNNNWNFHIESTEAAMRAGIFLKAHQHSNLALSAAERSYPNDPRLALSWHNFSETSRLAGFLNEAAQYYGNAGKLFETTLRANSISKKRFCHPREERRGYGRDHVKA